MAKYLGLDSSTQSLSAVVIDTDSKRVVYENTVNFGNDLPEFHCPNGYLENDDPSLRHSDPLMWLAALDLVLKRGTTNGVDWSTISGISGSGQQHGTVYLKEDYLDALTTRGSTSLADRFTPYLSRKTAPIWMDSSTTEECAEYATALGGSATVCEISGSIPIERFSGPQIRKFHKTEPEAYATTGRIHLVSSFLAAVLCGNEGGIDRGDGAGMNLMDLSTGDWSHALLAACAPNLIEKLPKLVPGGSVLGKVAKYFQENYGFSSICKVTVWSGDNPCSLVGMGSTGTGKAVISLGTSDTFFGALPYPRFDPNGYGHVFGTPTNDFMCLICFKNGSLAREAVKDRFGMDWAGCADAVASMPVGNNGNFMIPWFEPETTPKSAETGPFFFGKAGFGWGDKAAVCRAVIEGQALSMRIHTKWTGVDVKTIRVTGGASRDDSVVQILANVFGATIERLESTGSAGLGAALMAAQSDTQTDWSTLYDDFVQISSVKLMCDPSAVQTYADLLPIYESHVNAVLRT